MKKKTGPIRKPISKVEMNIAELINQGYSAAEAARVSGLDDGTSVSYCVKRLRDANLIAQKRVRATKKSEHRPRKEPVSRNKILELHKAGLRQFEIAREMGVSRQYISQILAIWAED